MSYERTEEQILARDPLLLKFGESSYPIPILSIGKSRAWRESLIEQAKEIAGTLFNSKETNGHDQAFFHGLGVAFLGFPEKMADLVFSYAGESLPREKVLEEATDEQLALAFSRIMAIAFPFARQISLMSSILQAGANLSASGKSTK